MNRYYLTDGSHVFIAGATGSKEGFGGKTSTANWWFEQSVQNGTHHGGLFFNVKGHSRIRGAEVQSLSGLAQSYRSGKRLFNYNPPAEPGDKANLADEWDRVIETLRQLPGEWIVVADEAQDYKDSAYLDWVLSQGGNLDEGAFTALVISQRLWNLPEHMRGNMPVKIWVGPLTSEGEKFFRHEGMKSEIPKIEENTGPYRWNVTDAGEYQHTNPPVPEEYA